MNQGRLEGKIALVTGSTRGIGAAIAKAFGAHGAKVVVSGRSSDDGNRVADHINQAGGTGIYVPLDMAEEDSVSGAVARTVAEFGGLTVLVNNAAPSDLITGVGTEGGFAAKVDKSITDMSTEDWRRVTRPMFDGLFWMLKYGITAMLESGGGSIVNISSLVSVHAVAGEDAYVASKGAMNSLTRSMAVTYAPNIRCNAIICGTVLTEGVAPLMAEPAIADAFHAMQLTGAMGRPEQLADATVYLASDDSSYITGQLIHVDGGASVPMASPKIEAGG